MKIQELEEELTFLDEAKLVEVFLAITWELGKRGREACQKAISKLDESNEDSHDEFIVQIQEKEWR